MKSPRARRTLDGLRSNGIGTLVQWGVFIAVALLMMWPATFRMTDEFVGWRDANYYMWLSWRLGELLQSGDIFSFTIPDIVHPLGVDLLLIDGHLPSFYGGFLNLFFGPFLAFNLTALTGTLLNMWAAARLARLFSKDRLVWITVGVAFALAPAIALRMTVHLPMYFAFTVPLLLIEAVRTVKDEEPVRPVRVGILLFVAYLCSIYFLIFGAIAYVVILLVGSIGTGRFVQALARTGLALLLTGLLMSPFLAARVSHDKAEERAGGEPVLLEDTFRAAADGLSIIAQPQGSTFDLPGAARLRDNFRDDNVHESTVFPGFLLLLGFVGLAWRRTRVALALACAAVVLWILTLGTSLKFDGNFLWTHPDGEPIPWLPYALLLELPGLGSLRAANRVSYALAAVLAACLALTMGHLLRKVEGAKRLFVGVGASVLLATSLIVPVPTSTMAVSQPVESALRRVDEISGARDAALVVPADCLGATLWAVRLQILHRTPVIGCQSSGPAIPWYSGLDVYAESAELAALRCTQQVIGRRTTNFDGDETFEPADVAALREDLDVRFLIVDKQLLNLPKCGIEEDVVEDLRTFDVLAEDDDWMIVDTL